MKDQAIGSFTLDGIKGFVFASGWIQWSSISCDIKALADCKLRDKAIKALNKANRG